MPISPLGLRTVIYMVPDLTAAKAWYAAAFATEPYFDEPFYVGFSIGGYELGLHPMEGAPLPPGGVTTYWGVEDVDAVYEDLLQRGASEDTPPEEVGGGIKVAVVRDP